MEWNGMVCMYVCTYMYKYVLSTHFIAYMYVYICINSGPIKQVPHASFSNRLLGLGFHRMTSHKLGNQECQKKSSERQDAAGEGGGV